MSYNKEDTKLHLITPALTNAGWKGPRITMEYPITAGRIVLQGDGHKQLKPKKADYLLRYSESLPIAVVEAKDEEHTPGAGLQQAKEYAEKLGVLFEYSSNGHGFEEGDFTTNFDADGLDLTRAIREGAEVYIPQDATPRDRYDTPDFERQVTMPDRMQRHCEHLAKLVHLYGRMEKTIIFCVSQDHAEQVRDVLNRLNADLNIPEYAVRIVSEESDAQAPTAERAQDSRHGLEGADRRRALRRTRCRRQSGLAAGLSLEGEQEIVGVCASLFELRARWRDMCGKPAINRTFGGAACMAFVPRRLANS